MIYLSKEISIVTSFNKRVYESDYQILVDSMRETHPEIDLYADDKHPSREGTYLAAATIYASIFQTSPVGNTYKFDIEPEVRKKLQTIAWETYLEYYHKK